MATNGTARRSKQGYLQTIYSRYRQAGRAEKQTMLDECTAVCGYHRKYAIGLLNRPLPAGFRGQVRGQGSVFDDRDSFMVGSCPDPSG